MRGVSDLDPAIWAPVPIAPMPMLACLRVCILSRSAKPTSLGVEEHSDQAPRT